MMAFLYFPQVFSDASSINFVDHMGVIHVIVNGASSQVDLGAMALGLHRRLAQLRTSVWWEYVPSPSNIADGGSRVGITCPMAAEVGIKLRLVPCRVWPYLFPRAHPESWLQWWG